VTALAANGNGNGGASRGKWAVLTGIGLSLTGVISAGVGGMFSYLQNAEGRILAAEVRAAMAAEDLALFGAIRDLREDSQRARGELDARLHVELLRLDAMIQKLDIGKVNEETRKSMLAVLERDINRLEDRLDRMEDMLGRGGDPR
jgi:polyhydroxyalkanoate synthesis regulator phasin